MNVLVLGSDQTLAMESPMVPSDSQERLVQYAAHLSQVFVVVSSPRRAGLRSRALSSNVLVCPTSSLGFLFPWDTYKIASGICRQNRIDVVTTQDPFIAGLVGYLLKRRYGLPLGVHLHNTYPDDPLWLRGSPSRRLWRLLGNWLLRRADCVRVVRDEVAAHLVQRLGIPREKVMSFPVPVNLARFAGYQGPLTLRSSCPQFRNLVLFSGRLIGQKNVPTLLRAAVEVVAQFPETLFVLAGDGPERQPLSRLAQELGVARNVLFAGWVSNEELPAYYHSCDLLVLPSWFEGWPRVVIEALASGKPVVISERCGSAAEVARRGLGLTFPPQDPHLLARHIAALLENPQLGRQMGERGRQWALDAYDLKRNAHLPGKFFEKTMELARSSRSASKT